MALCITFGTHEFTSMLEGYENVRAYCYNCRNWNGHCITRWPFFTICFIEVMCYTCRFSQDLRDRPDITPDTRPPPMPAYPWAPPGPHQPPMAYGAQQPPTEGQKSQPAPPEQHAPAEYK
ncbi:hypothetical protein N7493_007574 [Penicillium malachiteum]|uniref:Uncharacterized protein n=1 Tax=Penicillium malachiteum TaxID=1324776 RepID=A0AAD6HI03_9EURO|nr:hypothetical protein N7493_007574 [Penicillium malachiteum]